MADEITHKKRKLSIGEIIADIKKKGITFKYISDGEGKNERNAADFIYADSHFTHDG